MLRQRGCNRAVLNVCHMTRTVSDMSPNFSLEIPEKSTSKPQRQGDQTLPIVDRMLLNTN